MEIKVLNKMTIRSDAIAGNRCKQYARIVKDDNHEAVLLVKKLILTDNDKEASLYLAGGFTPLKRYKNYILFGQNIGFKLSTFNKLSDFVEETFNARTQ